MVRQWMSPSAAALAVAVQSAYTPQFVGDDLPAVE